MDGGESMDLEECVRSPLWSILVETAHAIVMYPHHKSYVRDSILRDNPNIDAREIQHRLGIPLGEALVILHELNQEGHEGR